MSKKAKQKGGTALAGLEDAPAVGAGEKTPDEGPAAAGKEDGKDKKEAPAGGNGNGREMLIRVPLKYLRLSATNPRKSRDEKADQELADSMKAQGLLQPIVVRVREGGKYEVVLGSRRFQAAQALGWAEIPCLERKMDDAQAAQAQLVENLQRTDVPVLEEAAGIAALLKEHKLTVDQVAARIGRSVRYVYDRASLVNKLTPEVRKAGEEGKLPATHLIELARLQPKDQKEMLAVCLDRWNGLVSVRRLQEQIAQDVHCLLAGAPWKKDDETLNPEAGPCQKCHKRSDWEFGSEKLGGKSACLDPMCFQKKTTAHMLRIKKEAEAAGEKVVEISDRSYLPYGEKLPPKVLARSRYEEAKASDPKAVKAIVVDSDNGRSLGQVKHVRLREEVTATGNPRMTEKEKAERKKTIQRTRVEKTFRRWLLAEMLEAVKDGETCVGLLREVLAQYLEEKVAYRADAYRTAAELLGWDPETKQPGVATGEAVKKADKLGLGRLLLVCLAIDDVAPKYENWERTPPELLKRARDLGVKVEALRKKAEQAPKENSRRAAKARSTEKAGGMMCEARPRIQSGTLKGTEIRKAVKRGAKAMRVKVGGAKKGKGKGKK